MLRLILLIVLILLILGAFRRGVQCWLGLLSERRTRPDPAHRGDPGSGKENLRDGKTVSISFYGPPPVSGLATDRRHKANMFTLSRRYGSPFDPQPNDAHTEAQLRELRRSLCCLARNRREKI